MSSLPKVWQCFETVGKREPQATEAFWVNSDLTGSGGSGNKRGNHVPWIMALLTLFWNGREAIHRMCESQYGEAWLLYAPSSTYDILCTSFGPTKQGLIECTLGYPSRNSTG